MTTTDDTTARASQIEIDDSWKKGATTAPAAPVAGVDVVADAKTLADGEADMVRQFLGKTTLAKTFFAYGTKMLAAGEHVAMEARAKFDELPFASESADKLIERIASEQRRDYQVRLADLHVDERGVLRRANGGLVLDGVAWQQIAGLCPEELQIDSRLRSNLNGWLRLAGDKEVRLRTRYPDQATRLRQAFAAVSTSYTAYDWDRIAADIARVMPGDAKAEVRYDGRRASFDVILHNPYKVEELGVGRTFRVMVSISSADDGREGYRIRYKAVRIRCINCTLVSDAKLKLNARHVGGPKFADLVGKAIGEAGQAMDSFAAAWADGYTRGYTDYDGTPIGAEESFKRLIVAKKVYVPGLKRDELLHVLMTAWAKEPGDTLAHVNAAITRAAHESASEWSSPWVTEDLEETAGELLYATVKECRLPDIDKEKRAEWNW